MRVPCEHWDEAARDGVRDEERNFFDITSTVEAAALVP